MKKKTVIISSTIIFILSARSFAAESGGMPQLDPEFWISQIFWLIITFGILFFILSKLILPKISFNLESRKSQILENIELAERYKEDSETKIKEYEKLIDESKIKANNIINEGKLKLMEEIKKKQELLENEINSEIETVEKEIEDLKRKSPDKIQQIAVDASSNLLKQLIGVEVNKSSISAIVDDLIKKNKGKNYGI